MNIIEQSFYTEILKMSKNNFLEVRIFDIKNNYWISEYTDIISDLENIYNKYNNENYIMYYGTNVRSKKGRKVIDIEYRRFFYFDIEKNKDKPKFLDEIYKKELLETAVYIAENLENKYKLIPNIIYCSGRGVHLGYAHKPISVLKFDKKFKLWYKNIQLELDKNKPHEDIKFLDSTFDAARIGSFVGSINYKYPEKPKREIIKINTEVTNDLEPVLNEFILPTYKFNESFVISSGKQRLYNEKTIIDAPEFQVFKCQIPPNQGYEIHNKLLFALKLLMDKYDIKNREEVGRAFESLGYWYEDMCPVEDKSYTYSNAILNNWVMENWEFCLDHNFLLPYPILYSRSKEYMTKVNNKIDERNIDLKTPRMIINYIREWNISTMEKIGDREVYFVEDMKKNVMNKISNLKLKQWVEENKFLDKVKLVK